MIISRNRQSVRSFVGRFTKYGNDCECILLYGTQGGEAEGRNNDRENFFQGMSNFVKRNKWKWQVFFILVFLVFVFLIFALWGFESLNYI
jgi:hypothetical protein